MPRTAVHAVLVGGGIACLYAAFRLRKRHGRKFRIVILERTHRVGGRIFPQTFAGQTINDGAGVGRFRKDARLKSLLLELGIPIEQYTSPAMDDNDKIINGALSRLHRAIQPLREATSARPTFHAFAVSVLGPSAYAQFVCATGYSDFEQTDCVEALDNYGFDDTLGRRELFVVPWQRLLDELMKQSGAEVLFGQSATRVRPGAVYSISEDGTRQKFRAALIMVGVTINCLRRIIPDRNIYSQVQSQPFIKLFAQIAARDPSRAEEATSFRLCDSGPIGKPLQKIFLVDRRTNLYNVAYADNESARLLRISGKREVERLFSSVAGFSVAFSLYHEHYWCEGTHYFPPSTCIINKNRCLHALQRPCDGVWVVGEAVSRCHQGWTEGALESVDELAADLFM